MYYSKAFITFNSNKCLDDVDEYYNDIRDFLKEDMFDYIEVVGSNEDARPHMSEIKVKFGKETGKKFGKVHAHVLIRYAHDVKLKWDFKGIRQYHDNIVGDASHVDIKVKSDEERMLEAYVEKEGDVEEFEL